MPPPRRLVLYGVAVAAFEAAFAIGLASTLGPQQVSLVLAVSAALTAGLSVAVGLLLKPRGGDPVRSSGCGEPDPEPPWWPGFERELRAHMRERERSPA